MAYCRWSSDWGECDVYVYEDVHGGWTTHVASRRFKHRVPDEIRSILKDENMSIGERYVAAAEAERRWRESFSRDELGCPSDSEYIDLSAISEFAGQTFNDPTPGDCADRLEEIRASGLNVPQYAIDNLRAEQAELG